MVKKRKLSYYKKKAWAACSEYNRRKNADSEGFVRCVTCGKRMHWKEAQAGHFIDGRMNSILFDDRGIWCQCDACNVFKHGNKVEYFRFMQKKYGDKVIDELRVLSKQALKLTANDLIAIEHDYKEKINHLRMFDKIEGYGCAAGFMQ